MSGFLHRLSFAHWTLIGTAVVGCALIVGLARYPSLLSTTSPTSMTPPGAYAPRAKHDTLEQRESMIRTREQDLARRAPEKVPPLPEQKITPRVVPPSAPAAK
jgi:hypothetical protein